MKIGLYMRLFAVAGLLAVVMPMASQTLFPVDSAARMMSPTVVTAEDVKQQVTNPLEAINGRVAGVTIQKSNNGAAAILHRFYR